MSDNKSQRPKRILLKLSGEALMGEMDFGLDPEILKQTASQIVEQQQLGTEVALVIGGGNIFRGEGLVKGGINKVSADQMGMLATVMNALAMQDALHKQGVSCRVMTAMSIDSLGESFSADKARRYLSNGEIVIFAAGTGNPCFTTDSAASLRAIEIEADLLLKATKVDGVYNADPKKDPAAVRYDTLNFDDAIDQRLAVMDMTAMVLCRENNMPMRVFNMFDAGALAAIMDGQQIGTLVEVA
ncbi:UMP kinase [Leucothrix arctica]|uniref:Uridylate kinase n=1 Tax=Leucothrix arctica TaxID=1481894 RepID=A0A317CIT6_9GAMM|nr:UMP kinase [Leucothrix arctica]PWQ98101.1 UMP kinase [Leucothrix arctica]